MMDKYCLSCDQHGPETPLLPQYQGEPVAYQGEMTRLGYCAPCVTSYRAMQSVGVSPAELQAKGLEKLLLPSAIMQAEQDLEESKTLRSRVEEPVGQ